MSFVNLYKRTSLELVTLNAPAFSSLVIVGPLYKPDVGLPALLWVGAEVCLFFDIGG